MYLDLNRAYQSFFTQTLKSETFKTSQLRLLAEVCAEMNTESCILV